MSDAVYIRFGAQLDELIEGVRGAREAIESIKESTDKVTEGFKKLLEVAGITLTLEGLKSFVEKMAELGDKTQTSMAQLGQSAEQITLLQGVAAVSGTSFDGLQQAIEKGALTVQRSTKDAYNPAAQALKTLGLSARELVGLPADQWFEKVADAVSQFNPSLNLTNAVTAAFGRGASTMLPLLLEGSEHFKELAVSVRQAQEGLAAAIPGMADTHEKIEIMALSVQSLGARIFSVLKPAIDGAITWFTTWVQSLDTKTIAASVTRIVELSTDAMLSIGNMAISLLETFATVSGGLDPLIKKIEVLALGSAIGTMLAGTKGAIAGAGLAAAVSLFAEQYQKVPTVAEQTNVNLDAARAKLNAIVAGIRESFSHLNTEAPTPEHEEGKRDAGAIDVGLKNTLTAQATKIEAEIAAEQAKLERIKAIFQQEADAYRITENQKAVMTETATEQAYQAEMTLVAQKAKLYAGDAVKFAEVEKEKAKLTEQYQTQMLRIVQDSMRQMTATVTSGLNSFVGAFNSQLRGLLAGTTSWATAIKNIGGDMFLKLVEYGEQWAVKKMATLIADSVLEKTKAAEAIATAATTEAAKTEAVVTGAAARASAEASGGAVGIAAQISNAITSIGIDAGKVFAGVFGFLAPVMGPAAAGPAAASSAEALAGGLAPLAVGAWEIPGVMGALLHPGEMVVPATFASGLRAAVGGGGAPAAGGGGGAPINFNFGTVFGTQAFIGQIMPQLARALNSYQLRNPSLAS